MTKRMTTVEAKENFIELINHVHHSKEQVILTRRGNEIAAIIPFEDLQILLESQDKHDLQDATEALQEARTSGTISVVQLAEDIGNQS